MSRRELLDKIDTMVGEVERMIQRADEYAKTAEKLERDAEQYREKHDETYVTIRKTNSEINKLIAEMRGRTS